MGIEILVCLIIGCVCFFAGYHAGTKRTTINRTVNYTGDFEKLIVNGQVLWQKPQEAEETQAHPPTKKGCN